MTSERTLSSGVTVFVPAFNEERNISAAVHKVFDAATQAGVSDYEVLIVNDGSLDGTASIAREMAGTFERVRYLENPRNLGLGASLRRALEEARYEKFIIVAGDNDASLTMVTELLSSRDQADLVIAYCVNKQLRGRLRCAISDLYSRIYTDSFGLRLRYINGTAIYPTARMRSLGFNSTRFSIAAEIIVKLLRSGCAYREIPGQIQNSLSPSSSLNFRSALEVARSYFRLLWEVYVLEKHRYSAKPRYVRD